MALDGEGPEARPLFEEDTRTRAQWLRPGSASLCAGRIGSRCPAQALAVSPADQAVALASHPLQTSPVRHLKARPPLPDQARLLEPMQRLRDAGAAHAQVAAEHLV